MTGLYLHIPFCVKKCHYCDFVITSAGPGGKQEVFFPALRKEMGHRAFRFKETAFDTLYIGGGTPSTLRRDQTEKLFSWVRKNFRLKKDAEITYETNPGDIDGDKAKLYADLGINRISLGAQSFNEDTLRRINRAHTVADIFQSFDCLRGAGFTNINLDLILSLPGEALPGVKDSVQQVVGLGAEHVSLYELTVEEKTVFGREFKEGRLKLPAEKEQLEMLSFAREYLKSNGFRHYELLNYARHGFESRHNLLYWANEEYLGLGPGAFSYFDGRRFRNSASFEEYLQKIEKDDWAAFEEETLSPEKREIESLLLALRLTEGADLGRFGSLIERLNGNISDLEEKGLLTKEAQKIRLTPRGQYLAETVFAELSS